MLAGLVASPTKYAPHRNMELARERQQLRARRTCARTTTSPTPSTRPRSPSRSRSSTRATSTTSRRRTSSSTSASSRPSATATRRCSRAASGSTRRSTPRMQAAAEGALRKGLESLDRRLGFRGPIGSVADRPARRVDRRPRASADRRHRRHQRARRSAAARAALRRDDRRAAEDRRRRSSISAPSGCRSSTPTRTTCARGATRRPAKPRRARRPAAGAARPPTAPPRRSRSARRCRARWSSIEPHTGRVLALVGGYDWTASQFDRATQAKRQVGSSIKPFIYAAALEAGTTPVERMHDGPFSVTTATGVWTPANYDNKYMGDVTLMTALALLAQHDQRAARRAGRPRSHHRDHARLRHHVADPAPHLDRARHARPHAARDRDRLRRHRERRPPRHAAVLRSRHRHRAATSSRICATRRRARRCISPEVAYVHRQPDEGRRPARHRALRARRSAAPPPARPARQRELSSDVWFIGFTTDLLARRVDRPRRLDADRRQDHRRRRGGADLARLHAEGAPAHDGPRLPGAAERQFRARRAVERRSRRPVGRDSVWMPFVRGTLPQKFLAGPPMRSFDDLVPAPAVPRAPNATRCPA